MPTSYYRPHSTQTRPRALRTTHMVLALSLLLASATAFAQVEATVEADSVLPVTRVALTSSGVGYFEREGTVDGTVELHLDVPKEEMNDFLASLIVQDFGGGTVEPVRYDSEDALPRYRSGEPSLSITGEAGFVGLLNQATGEQVEVSTGGDLLTGTLVSAEEQHLEGGEKRILVTLVADGRLRRVALGEAVGIRFLDSAVAGELDAALVALAQRRKETVATLRIRFTGEGERQVSVAYAREMPVWKSSYRLAFSPDGEAVLQGWATIDNPTTEALTDVELSFVAGQPVAFITELYEPFWVQRPRIGVTAASAAGAGVAAADQMGARMLAAPAPAFLAEMEQAPMAAAPQLSGAGVAEQASGEGGLGNFAYTVNEPVTVGANESALVPLVVRSVAGERLSVYDSLRNSDRPLHAFHLTNDTGMQLPAGSVTLYDERGFAGNALLPDLVPGQETTLAFATDLSMLVSLRGGSRSTSATRASLRGGLLEVTELTRQGYTVTVDAVEGESRFLLIDGPAVTGFSVVAPEGAVVTPAGRVRLGVAVAGTDGALPTSAAFPTHLACPAGESCELIVELERVDRQTVRLTDLAPARITEYLQNVELSAEDRALLGELQALNAEIGRVDREIATNEALTAALVNDQARIRSNMAELDRDSELYGRYVDQLTGQEDDLTVLRNSRAELQVERDALAEELRVKSTGLGR